MIYDLARLELIERRTAKPALYPKIRVEDLGDSSALSIRIAAKAGGETAADLLVGFARPEELGAAASSCARAARPSPGSPRATSSRCNC